MPDANDTPSADFASQPAGTYDDEMLDAHFACGDGRCNENIALSTIHQVFHSEHNRLVDEIDQILTNDTTPPSGVAALANWKAIGVSGYDYGERLFQAARFITEMQYQHLVFEEFARKVQPAIRPFHLYSPEVNPAVEAEFAHAVYRFGHSMLDDDVARTNGGDGSDNSLPLLTAFLNPPAYFDGGSAGTLNAKQAAGSIVMGSSDQVGNELDEFVTETLRNNLLGLPLDLPSINMTRAREAGIPPLNDVRRQIFAETNDGQMTPYTSWSDFGQHLKHPRVADQLRRGLRQAPEHHRRDDPGRQAGRCPGDRQPAGQRRPAGRRVGLHVQHRRLVEQRQRRDHHRPGRRRPLGGRPGRDHQPLRRTAGQHVQLRVPDPAGEAAGR